MFRSTLCSSSGGQIVLIQHLVSYRVYTKECAVSKVNKKYVSHLILAQRTPSAAATVQVSHSLPAVCFSCLLRGRGAVSKMASQLVTAFFVFRFEVSRTVITVQREFPARFRKGAPCRNNITRWYRQFVGTGCLCKGKSPGRPRVSDEH